MERATPIKFTNDENALQFNFVLGDNEYQAHRQLAEETLSENYLNGYALNSLADSPVFSTKLLQINTDLYPDSANTWDSLALAYQQAGNNKKAIEHYRNALKRDPKFASALKALTELNKNNPE